jgi:hypothetical protein
MSQFESTFITSTMGFETPTLPLNSMINKTLITTYCSYCTIMVVRQPLAVQLYHSSSQCIHHMTLQAALLMVPSALCLLATSAIPTTLAVDLNLC